MSSRFHVERAEGGVSHPALRAPMVKTIAYHECLRTAPRKVIDGCLMAHAVLRAQGLTDVDLLGGEEELVYAQGWPAKPTFDSREEVPGRILGVLLWTPQDDNSWWTELGYVEPACRGQGIYTMLWEACVHKAKEAGVARIQGGTAWSNKGMQALMERLGRKPHSIVYEYEVPRG